MKSLRTKVRETIKRVYRNNYQEVDIFSDDLSVNGIASKLASAITKRVKRHIQAQKQPSRKQKIVP